MTTVIDLDDDHEGLIEFAFACGFALALFLIFAAPAIGRIIGHG
jgi:hypothetical protein